jgi:hypothetical protein
MRRSNWTPSIVPNGNDQTVYLVADDFGKNGRAWRETDCDTADLETIIPGFADRSISQPDPRHRLQHRRTLVGRRLRRCCP